MDLGVTVWKDCPYSHTHTGYGSNSFKWTDNGDGTHSSIADCKTCGVRYHDGSDPKAEEILWLKTTGIEVKNYII